MHNLFVCMVSLNVDPRIKNVYYSGCDISRFQNFTHDRILTVCPSSCTSLTSKSGWECPYLMQSWNCQVDYLKDYLCLESYLLNFPSLDQLLSLLANLALQIYLLSTPTISLCDDEYIGYHVNQVPLISPHRN